MITLGTDCSPLNFSEEEGFQVLLQVSSVRRPDRRVLEDENTWRRSDAGDVRDFSKVGELATGKGH